MELSVGFRPIAAAVASRPEEAIMPDSIRGCLSREGVRWESVVKGHTQASLDLQAEG